MFGTTRLIYILSSMRKCGRVPQELQGLQLLVRNARAAMDDQKRSCVRAVNLATVYSAARDRNEAPCRL